MTLFEVTEKGSFAYSATIRDAAGVAVPGTSLTTLLLTFYNADTMAGAIVNSRDHQSVLNVNNVAVDGAGRLVWTMQPADLVIQNARRAYERHEALFEWTYPSGSGRHVVGFRVKNLRHVE